MKIHILVVEDDPDFIQDILKRLSSSSIDFEPYIAESRDKAIELLNQEAFFDLVILDLKIPTIDGALDEEPEHGQAVFAHAQNVAPGMPIIILTGSSAQSSIPQFLSAAQQIDIWGEGIKRGNIEFQEKYLINEFPRRLNPILNAINSLSEIELQRNDIELTSAEDRLLRIFTRKYGGLRGEVTGLTGGLSDSRVVRIIVTDRAGVVLRDAVAKLGNFETINSEDAAYDQHIARLDAAVTPRRLSILEFGAYNTGGIFFSLARGIDRSVPELIAEGGDGVETLLSNLEDAFSDWVDGVPESRLPIAAARRIAINDDDFEAVKEKFDIRWADEFESNQIQLRWGCCHGDLHPFNILLSGDISITLIDYGDVGPGPLTYDPVTLELSLLFHPDCVGSAGDWPSLDQAKNWGTLDLYLAECPFQELVSGCRSWANRVSAGNRDLAASAYAYLVRQLKYPETNKDLVLALLEGVRRFYDDLH